MSVSKGGSWLRFPLTAVVAVVGALVPQAGDAQVPEKALECNSSIGITVGAQTTVPGGYECDITLDIANGLTRDLFNVDISQDFPEIQFFPSCTSTPCMPDPALPVTFVPGSATTDCGGVPPAITVNPAAPGDISFQFMPPFTLGPSMTGVCNAGEACRCQISFRVFTPFSAGLGPFPIEALIPTANPGQCTATGLTSSSSAVDDITKVAPDLEVLKDCRPDRDPVTGDFIYDVTITNTAPAGAGSLSNCAVVDSTATGCDRAAGAIPDIAPGDSVLITCTSTSPENTATVTCDNAGPQDSTAMCSPELEVLKECRDALDPVTGEFIYEVTITNTGGGSLNNCAVVDSVASGCDRAAGDIGPIAAGDSVVVSCTSPSATNMATVTCDNGGPEESTAMCPQLEVLKECRSTLDPVTSDFVYDVTITNTAMPGAGSLINCAVVDSTATGCDRAAGSIPDIAPGNSLVITCTSPSSSNTATVTCDNGGPEQSTATCSVVPTSDWPWLLALALSLITGAWLLVRLDSSRAHPAGA